MATHIEHSWTLPADPATVFAMLTDENYQRATGDATGAQEVSLTVDATGPGAVIHSVRKMSTADLPSAVQSFVGNELDIDVEQRWGPAAEDGSRAGTMRITVPGKPLDFTGNCSLHPVAEGSMVRITGDVDCSVPFVGGRVEKMVAPGMLEGFKIEEKQGRAYLAG